MIKEIENMSKEEILKKLLEKEKTKEQFTTVLKKGGEGFPKSGIGQSGLCYEILCQREMIKTGDIWLHLKNFKVT